jgi:GMP reductase
MIIREEHFDFDDLNIVPAPTSSINSRSECNVYDKFGMLPLFTAPMDTVVDGENAHIFNTNGIYPIIPRNCEPIPTENNWIAIGLQSFITMLNHPQTRPFNFDKLLICLDIANGHMEQLYDLIKKAKDLYDDNIKLIVGNVANPSAYAALSNAGADYVRVGIGNGAGCLTTLNTGVGYPMASLIEDVYDVSCALDKPAYIIADGGMQGYSDVIKSLALGADYVMIGSVFNKALESAGTTFCEVINRDGQREIGERVDQYDERVKIAFKSGARFHKKFRGMSTKDVQKELGNTTIRTSEGVYRTRMVEYTLEGWVENFKHYLSTAMSYTDAHNLEEFIGKVNLIHISQNSYKRVSK